MRRTFIFLKPETLERSLVRPVMKRLTDAGFCIETLDYVRVTEEKILLHYDEVIRREGEAFRSRILRCYVDRWILPVILSGESDTIISDVRSLIGATDPSKALPGTIRGDLATDSMEAAIREDRPCENLIHASDSEISFEYETGLWL